MKLTRNRTRKTMKQIFAMVAAMPAIAKKPSNPAMRAMMRKTTALPSIATSAIQQCNHFAKRALSTIKPGDSQSEFSYLDALAPHRDQQAPHLLYHQGQAIDSEEESRTSFWTKVYLRQKGEDQCTHGWALRYLRFWCSEINPPDLRPAIHLTASPLSPARQHSEAGGFSRPLPDSRHVRRARSQRRRSDAPDLRIAGSRRLLPAQQEIRRWHCSGEGGLRNRACANDHGRWLGWALFKSDAPDKQAATDYKK